MSRFNQQSPHSDVSVLLSCLQHFATFVVSLHLPSRPSCSRPSTRYTTATSLSALSRLSTRTSWHCSHCSGRFNAPSGIDYMSYTAESTEAYLWYKLASLGSTDRTATLPTRHHQQR